MAIPGAIAPGGGSAAPRAFVGEAAFAAPPTLMEKSQGIAVNQDMPAVGEAAQFTEAACVELASPSVFEARGVPVGPPPGTPQEEAPGTPGTSLSVQARETVPGQAYSNAPVVMLADEKTDAGGPGGSGLPEPADVSGFSPEQALQVREAEWDTMRSLAPVAVRTYWDRAVDPKSSTKSADALPGTRFLAADYWIEEGEALIHKLSRGPVPVWYPPEEIDLGKAMSDPAVPDSIRGIIGAGRRYQDACRAARVFPVDGLKLTGMGMGPDDSAAVATLNGMLTAGRGGDRVAFDAMFDPESLKYPSGLELRDRVWGMFLFEVSSHVWTHCDKNSGGLISISQGRISEPIAFYPSQEGGVKLGLAPSALDRARTVSPEETALARERYAKAHPRERELLNTFFDGRMDAAKQSLDHLVRDDLRVEFDTDVEEGSQEGLWALFKSLQKRGSDLAFQIHGVDDSELVRETPTEVIFSIPVRDRYGGPWFGFLTFTYPANGSRAWHQSPCKFGLDTELRLPVQKNEQERLKEEHPDWFPEGGGLPQVCLGAWPFERKGNPLA